MGGHAKADPFEQLALDMGHAWGVPTGLHAGRNAAGDGNRGVLSAIAAPSSSQLAASLQLTSAANFVVSSLHLARNEATKRNARVVVCKSTDGIGCASDGGWEQGWIVFHDVNNHGLREATEPAIQRQLALSSSLRVTGNATVASYIP